MNSKAEAGSVAPIGLEAVILAGGLGTRLRSVVSDRPKPMAPVGGKPFLEWLIKDLHNQGIQKLVLSTGHMSAAIEEYFGSGHAFGVDIVYSREEAPLGTGGAIKRSLSALEGRRFFALNGDSFCDFSLRRILTSYMERSTVAAMWLVPAEDCERYGAVSINQDGGIIEFKEKGAGGQSGLINAGVYLLDRKIFDPMPADAAFSLEKDLFPGLIGRGLVGVVGAGPFIDIGTPESYKIADLFIDRSRV